MLLAENDKEKLKLAIKCFALLNSLVRRNTDFHMREVYLQADLPAVIWAQGSRAVDNPLWCVCAYLEKAPLPFMLLACQRKHELNFSSFPIYLSRNLFRKDSENGNFKREKTYACKSI
jgi:hypothetical protein